MSDSTRTPQVQAEIERLERTRDEKTFAGCYAGEQKLYAEQASIILNYIAALEAWPKPSVPTGTKAGVVENINRGYVDQLAENERLRDALEEVLGCFNAAFVEGLRERMAELDDKQPGSIYDLIQRRLMWACEHTVPGALTAYKAAALDPANDNGAESAAA